MSCACGENATRIGDLEIVWPSDVDDYIKKLDVDFQATQRAVQACQGIPPTMLASWNDFFSAWGKFRDEGTGIFGSGSRLDNARGYQRNLSNWQALIGNAKCELFAPTVGSDPEGLSSLLKWVAAAVVVGGAVYTFGPLLRKAFK